MRLPMVIGVPKETLPGENRVAIVPASIPGLIKAGFEVLVEHGAGMAAGFPDGDYLARGATLVSRDDVFGRGQLILQVRTPAANAAEGSADLARLASQHTVIGLADPLTASPAVSELASRGVTSFAMELIPRITRAQSMDVLSSMANIAGYKAVLLAADSLPRVVPMMMTAAGTITAARVFVIGAGVAGLQAIATAKRLGARVEAYDVRPAVKEQIESLGAKFVELPIEAGAAEDRGGYATAQDESFYRRQRETMAKVVAHSDIVITTAAIPGKRSPVLVTADMVATMAAGSVIVDLAAERGGNCESSVADQTVVVSGVTIHAPTNLPATVPYHASQMYARNMTTLVAHLWKNGVLSIDQDDEITRETLVTRGGDVVHPRVRETLGLPPRPVPALAPPSF
jgi:H+-translocating NAD(P) transhydrogenase subunit alpha